MTARFSADDYAGAVRALLPRGRVWGAESGSTQDQVIRSLMPAAEQADADAVALLVDAFPATATDLLTEWEETLGLPDPCLGANPTIQQRRDQVRARIGNGGGQSVAFFTAFADALGFEITITEYAPFRAGRSRAGQLLGGAPAAHTWLVTIVSSAVSADHAAFRAGVSRAGDPLASDAAGHAALECELRRLAPAHTVLLFTY